MFQPGALAATAVSGRGRWWNSYPFIGRAAVIRRRPKGSDMPAHWGDRADDPRLEHGGDSKGAVLGRVSQRWLCLASLLVIVYGTLGPLGLSVRSWIEPAAAWRWIPLATPTDANDVFTNIVVYVPVGLAFRLLLRRRRRAGLSDLALGLASSLALSYVTELLQQHMPARSSNLDDVWMNTFGAGIGCALAPLVQRRLRRGHAGLFTLVRERPWTALSLTAWIATLALMTVPWTLKRPDWRLDCGRDFELLDLQRIGLFAVVGFFSACSAIARRGLRGSVLLRLAALGGIATATLEASQISISRHSASAHDLLIQLAGGALGVLGAAVGASAAIRRARRAGAARGLPRLPPPPRALAAIALLVSLGLIAAAETRIQGLTPGDGLRFRLHPFEAQFHQPFDFALLGMAESLTRYFFLTLLALYLSNGRGARAALALVAALVVGLEFAGALVDGRVVDATPLVLAATAWLLAVRAWFALFPTGVPSTRKGGAVRAGHVSSTQGSCG